MPLRAAVAIAALSGAASLAWQGLWSIQLATSLGHELMATLGVMAAIFAGMAMGAGLLGPLAEQSLRPRIWYAALEALIGAWGLMTVTIIPSVVPLVARTLGEQPSATAHVLCAFLLPCALLLPSTVAMGASLPALVRAINNKPYTLGPVYGANTAGAMAGVALTVFLLVQTWGVHLTAVLAATVNFAAAVAAGWGLRTQPQRQQPASSALTGAEVTSSERTYPASRVLVVLALTGFLGIGYETLCIRVVSQVTENTVYSYAVLLCVFLLGTAAGSFLKLRPPAEPHSLPWLQLMATGMAVAWGCMALWWADALSTPAATLAPGARRTGPFQDEVLVALAAMLVPAIAMGAAFTALCQWARNCGVRLGTAFAVNTAGAAFAPAFVGVLAIPAVGAGPAAAALIAGYPLLALATYRSERKSTLVPTTLLAAGICAAATVAALGPPLRVIDLGDGDRLRHHEDGPMAAVSVVQDGDGILRLRINNRVQEGSSAASPIETRLALVPLMLHPAPKRTLILGWGTGYTASLAALDSSLSVDVVELLPEVVRASSWFTRTPGFPEPSHPPRLITADARRFVLASEAQYDVVVADLFHPARSGAGSLYTVEHFRALARRLAPGGIVCQWLALHQMEWSTFRLILAAFREVFPDAVVLLASNSLETPVLGLAARPGAAFADLHATEQRMVGAQEAYAKWLESARLLDAHAVLGTLVAGPLELDRWVQGVTPNSDDRPSVSHAAPWDTYSPRTSPPQRLATLLSESGNPGPPAVQAALKWMPNTHGEGAAAPAGDANSISAYIDARNQYLRLGLMHTALSPTELSRDALRRELQLLLSISPQFTPAIDALRSFRNADPTSSTPR